MTFLDVDTIRAFSNPKSLGEATPAAHVSGSETWLRSTRRAVSELQDEQGFLLPLRDEQIWVNVSPTHTTIPWRAEAELLGSGIVGRGSTPDAAIRDWKKRFRTTLQVYLAMRPFEMTPEDKAFWEKVPLVIDLPRYKVTKPIVIRQTGVVRKAPNGNSAKIIWSGGASETVAVAKFDESFSRYRAGQPFEATVYRHPVTFRLMRAEATRKLPAASADFEATSKALWKQIVGAETLEPSKSEFDADYWLAPTQRQS